MKTIILLTFVTALTACGPSASVSEGSGPRPAGGSSSDHTCTTLVSTAEDSRALADIAKMTQAQCRDNLQQLISFYQATESMTEEQARAYFQQMIVGISPAPPPPPLRCSIILDAIEKCAKGS